MQRTKIERMLLVVLAVILLHRWAVAIAVAELTELRLEVLSEVHWVALQ